MDAGALLEPPRRRFVKQMRNSKSPTAETAVRQIAILYAIEASVRGMAPALRLAARQAQSAPSSRP
jgi:hypothetical protein